MQVCIYSRAAKPGAGGGGGGGWGEAGAEIKIILDFTMHGKWPLLTDTAVRDTDVTPTTGRPEKDAHCEVGQTTERMIYLHEVHVPTDGCAPGFSQSVAFSDGNAGSGPIRHPARWLF